MFNSLNYFNKKNNLPKPLYRYSNLGGTLGGPIPGSDKLFFFYSVDDTQSKNPQIARFYRMPTAKLVTGPDGNVATDTLPSRAFAT